MRVRCPDPRFAWNAQASYYEACSTCGAIAWMHKGCDPLGDVKAHARWLRTGPPPDSPPPAPIVHGPTNPTPPPRRDS